jgi:hypothetical protein
MAHGIRDQGDHDAFPGLPDLGDSLVGSVALQGDFHLVGHQSRAISRSAVRLCGWK